MNISVGSSLELLGIKLLSAFLSFSRCMASFFLHKYLGMKWLGRVISVWLTFEEIVKLFSKVVGPFFIPTSNKWKFPLFPILSSYGVGSLLKVSLLLYGFPDKARNPCSVSRVLPNYASTIPFESHLLTLYLGMLWISHENCSLNLQYLWPVSWVFQQAPFCPTSSHLSLYSIHQYPLLYKPAGGQWGPSLILPQLS